MVRWLEAEVPALAQALVLTEATVLRQAELAAMAGLAQLEQNRAI
jgi:hypothetical protein